MGSTQNKKSLLIATPLIPVNPLVLGAIQALSQLSYSPEPYVYGRYAV